MLLHRQCGGGQCEYNWGMRGALPLKGGWWEEEFGEARDGEEVMELHIVRSPPMEREVDSDPVIENLTDTQLDEKIDSLQKRRPGLKLADGGQKYDILIKKHIDEKDRRSRKTHYKVVCAILPIWTYCIFFENLKNLNSHLSIPDYQSWDARHQWELKPDDNNIADIRANDFDDDLDYANRKRKQLMGNGQQGWHDTQIRNSRCSPRQSISVSPSSCPSNQGKLSNTITRSNSLGSSQLSSITEENSCSRSAGKYTQIRNSRCSPRQSISVSPSSCPSNQGKLSNTITRSNSLGSSQLSSITEENSCSRSAGKRVADSTYTQNLAKKCCSFTPESSMKKIIVVLDEDDEKPKKQYQTRRMSARWKKDIRIYYPKRDHPESVEICLSDMECLAPYSYLSSAIMNFYIQYLQRSECTEQKNDYHFFNTFFYSKLEEALDSYSKQEDGNSFARLRRWFKGVNIFEKAYIFLPIHACQHWSLAIISIPAREDEAGPIILHLDSLGLHTSRTIFENIKSYLKSEWEHLHQAEVPTQVPIAEKIWKDLPHKIQEKKIEVPQQENDYDCGLFVLFFMERFIEEAPPRLRKTDLDRFGKKWFLPAEASQLRGSIRVLLEKHFKEAEKSNRDTKDDDSLPVVLDDLE